MAHLGVLFILLCFLGLLNQSSGHVASPPSIRAEWDGYDEEGALMWDINHSIRTTKQWIELQEHHHPAKNGDRSTGIASPRNPYTLSQRFGFTKTPSKIIAKAARVIENVTHIYGEERLKQLSKRQIQDLCEEAGFTKSFADCPLSTKYRTADGSCNNALNVNWGKSFTPFARALPPSYSDGVSEPRIAVSGNPLPSARTTSYKSFHFQHVFEPRYTTMIMNLGQFLDHDTDHSSTEEADCQDCQRTDKCLPIPIPIDDDFYTSQICVPFARSVPVPSPDCEPGPRQQINQVSSFLDLSQMYGSTQEDTDFLRDKSLNKGQLRSNASPRGAGAHPHLPNDEEHEDCFILRPEEMCGLAGDVRASEQPGLTALQTMFSRQHNSIANELSLMNPHWTDEIIFQEARRVMIGFWQHIVYNEYLPPLLGRKIMEDHKLRVHPSAFFYGYDPNINPSVLNVFATAAYRMGHSQIPPELLRVDLNYKPILPHIPYHQVYFNATWLYDIGNGGIDSIVRGMMDAELPKVDGYITTAVTRHLFADPRNLHGLDLVSLNIQRGRDHGLPPYTDWRRLCGITTGQGFSGLQPQLNSTKTAKFSTLYEHPDDIDAFTAIIMEDILPGALVGETLGCLLALQFHNLKYGDRFWYENGLGEQAFTSAQLAQIRKMTLARLICDNLDEIDTIQPYTLRRPDFGVQPAGSTRSFVEYSATHSFPDENKRMPGFFNGRISCNDDVNIPKMDLSAWKETP